MNELNGPFVIIVLNIREGRGFDFLQTPLYIEASLKGSKIQSDPAAPDPTPSICTELVWETQKREVRKLRSSHIPLRVDCFTVNVVDQQKERIGYIMLSLRSAQAVAGNQVSPVEHKWHKLVGVPSEYKVCHPELALTLTVRDRCYQEMQTMHPTVNTCIEQVLCEEVVHTDSDRPVIVPIMYLEDGCIRIGENCPDLQRFTLAVHIGTAINLDLLLPVSKVFQENKEKYCLSISILGMAINTKCFYKNLHEPIVLDDRVAIKLESTAQILKLFFDQYQYVPVHFCHGKEVLASTEIDFNGFFIIEQLENNTACRKEQDCLFHVGAARDIPSGADERKPAVNVETALNHYQNNTSTNSNASVSNSVDSFNNNSADSMDDTKHAGGDQKRQHDESKTAMGNKSVAPREDAAVQTTPRVEKIVPQTVLKTVLKKSQSRMCSTFNGLASYHLYNLTVTFCSITWRRSLELERFVIKFQHPKASNSIEIPCTVNANDCNQIITLKDVLCKMSYISTEQNIRTLISMYPVLVSLCKINGDEITDEFQVYTKMFLSQTEDECVYYTVLNTVNDKENLLCDLQIQMTITDHGISLEFDNPSDEFQLDPIILDDWFAVKMIKDLKEWKETQERLFTENLKRLQDEKLECLQSDWRNKRVILERKLQDGLENCKILYQQLTLTANEMKLQSAFCHRPEPCTMNSNRDAIEMRVTQMLEEEMNMTVRRVEREKQEIAEKIQVLCKEKCALEKTMQANRDELEELRKTTLTQSQTASLFQEIRTLEEKYQQALATKTFFKEQWQKTLNEVHALKCEDQRQIQQEIQRKKEELSQFKIDEGDSVFCTVKRGNTLKPGLESTKDVPVESLIF